MPFAKRLTADNHYTAILYGFDRDGSSGACDGHDATTVVLAVNTYGAGYDINGSVPMIIRQLERRTSRHDAFHIQGIRIGGDRRSFAERFAHNNAYVDIPDVYLRQLLRRVMLKCRIALLLSVRKCDPRLDAVQIRNNIQVIASTLRVDNASAGGHEIYGARPNRLDETQAISMHDLSLEEIGNGCDANVRVRSHVDSLAGWKFCGAHVIEENERSNHAPLR